MIAAITPAENLLATLLGVAIFCAIMRTCSFILGKLLELIIGKPKEGEE